MAARSTTTQNRHRATIRRGKPPCALCGGEIDYDADHLDPLSFVIDHIIPLARGGTDTLDNVQPAHRHCNRLKSDTDPEDIGTVHPVRVFVTERTW